MITTGDRAALLVEQAQGPGLLVISFDDAGASGSSVQFSDLLDAQAPAFEAHSRQSSDLATVCYTSGTTGHPKGAMQTHQSIVLNTELTSTLHGRNPHDVAVSALPCSHVYGNVVMNSAFLCGMTLVLHGSFDVERVMESIQKNRATLFEGVPTMYMYMLNFARASAYDMSSLQRCTVGGQTMPVSSMARVEKLLGCPLLELWGMTELAGLGTTFPLYGPRRPGSIGLPLPLLQARVVDADNPGRPLKPGEVGELRMKGPVVMSGYYGNDAGTRDSFDDEGWLRTGDLARIDAEGFIYVVDRLKDMIITGGYNIYPAEIERVLSGHPGVAMVAVGRISDEMKGELAKAYVVRSLAGEATEEDLLLYCREHLAAYKVPRVIAFVAELPKTSTGKVLRRMLHTLDIKPSDKQGA